MQFDSVLVSEKKEVIQYAEPIFRLFKQCFNKEIDKELWTWAYIDNPSGDPVISLCFYEGRLIGHYGVIPMPLIYKGMEVRALLSMTTMVHSSFRRHGILIKQAGEVYEQAVKMGYELVYGFPNKNSVPGFIKRLGWSIVEGHVINLSKYELIKLNKQSSHDVIKFDISNKCLLKWRLSKPHQQYLQIGKNITKNFNSDIDIVYHESNFDNLDINTNYNILVFDSLAEVKKKPEFSYVFGYKFFNNDLKISEFKVDLILSDLF